MLAIFEYNIFSPTYGTCAGLELDFFCVISAFLVTVVSTCVWLDPLTFPWQLNNCLKVLPYQEGKSHYLLVLWSGNRDELPFPPSQIFWTLETLHCLAFSHLTKWQKDHLWISNGNGVRERERVEKAECSNAVIDLHFTHVWCKLSINTNFFYHQWLIYKAHHPGSALVV